MGRGSGGTKATPGRVYYKNTDDGGEVTVVAGEAYGDPSKAAPIWNANPGVVKGTKLARGKEFIIPGHLPPTKLAGKEPDDLTIIVDGFEVPVVSARIIRTVDTGSDAWTARIPWTPGQYPWLDEATKPYGYKRAAAYIGNTLLVGGCLYVVEPEMTVNGMSKTLTGYSFTADAIDSHVQPPYEFNKVTLKQLADWLLPPLGVKGVWKVDPGPKFERVTAHESESVFAFLAKLASQRGFLASSTPQGDMLFHAPAVSGAPVAVIEEGAPFPVGWKARYDGRTRYRAYRCITKGTKTGPVLNWGSAGYGSSTKQKPSVVVEIDKSVPLARWVTFRADDVTSGDIKNAAKWKKNRQFVESLTQEFPVAGWHDPYGKLWRENTTVTVKSPTLGVPNGYTFLIRSVEYNLDERGQSAILGLVPPEAYTNRDIGDIWK